MQLRVTLPVEVTDPRTPRLLHGAIGSQFHWNLERRVCGGLLGATPHLAGRSPVPWGQIAQSFGVCRIGRIINSLPCL